MAERPEDLNLPNAVITRIIKDAIPEGVNVSKEARLAISKAASVFVLYATSCSNNFALKAKRKTINAQDVIASMEDMEFEHFQDPLKQCLELYRQGQKDKKDRKKNKEENVVTVEEGDSEVIENGGDDDEEEEDEDDDAEAEDDEEMQEEDVKTGTEESGSVVTISDDDDGT